MEYKDLYGTTFTPAAYFVSDIRLLSFFARDIKSSNNGIPAATLTDTLPL
jgi:hypothetical protein